MCAEKFDLKPAKQCAVTEEGHFGETLKEVYQGNSGLVARKETWTPQQFSGFQHELETRSERDGGSEKTGPYNKTFIDMAFHGDVYSLGQDTKTLTVDDKPVEKGSKQYKAAADEMEAAKKKINFDAAACPANLSGLWENLDKKD